jgi:hypothetical protein
MMAITTNSSISVNPEREPGRVFMVQTRRLGRACGLPRGLGISSAVAGGKEDGAFDRQSAPSYSSAASDPRRNDSGM